jgi:hypothetical protein
MAEDDETFGWKEAETLRMKNWRERQKGDFKKLEIEDKLMRQRRMMEVMTRIPSMGGVGGGAMGVGMGFLQNLIGTKMMGFNRLKDLQDKETGGGTLTSEEVKEKDMLSSQKRSNSLFQRLDKTFDKHFGGDSKWNKFFAGQGKGAALGMGAGAAAGGMMLGKAIIDSSPMFQQMLKLLNFGVMMVLRPIGDFFGFFMRPILIALLQKFIIPFYQTYLPVMQKLGTDIGERVVDFLNWIEAGIAALSGVFAREQEKSTGVIAAGNEQNAKTMTAAIEAAMLKEANMNPFQKNEEQINRVMGSTVDGISQGTVGNWQEVKRQFSDLDEVKNAFSSFTKDGKLVDTAAATGMDVFKKDGSVLFRNLPLVAEAIKHYENIGYKVQASVGTVTDYDRTMQFQDTYRDGKHLGTAPDPFMNIGGMENKGVTVEVNMPNAVVYDEYKFRKETEEVIERVLARRGYT